MGRRVAQMCIFLYVTWECGGWGGCGHSDGNAHAAAAAVLPTAAPTAAAGMAASTATTAHTHSVGEVSVLHRDVFHLGFSSKWVKYQNH